MSVLGKIERYLKRSGKKPTRFGIEVARDPKLVFDLRNGRQLGPWLEARIDAFLEAVQ